MGRKISAVIYLNFIFTTSEKFVFYFYQTTGGWSKLQLKYRILLLAYILQKYDTISRNMIIVACIVFNLAKRSYCFEVALPKIQTYSTFYKFLRMQDRRKNY